MDNIELPDWEDLNALAKLVSETKLRAGNLKERLDIYLAHCVKEAYTNQEYWPNHKPPTQSYIENTVKIIGNNANDNDFIVRTREEYRNALKEYDDAKATLNNLKEKISVFQTISANRRNGI